VSIYWFTATGGSSAQLYFENRRHHLAFAPGQRVDVPAGFSVFPHPPTRSRQSAEQRFQIAYWRDMPCGGHFPALEAPGELVEEIDRFLHGVGYLRTRSRQERPL
jgi:hypothetical protein